MAHVLFALLGPVMGQLLMGPDPENPDHQTFEQESGESRRDMAEDFAEWGRN